MLNRIESSLKNAIIFDLAIVLSVGVEVKNMMASLRIVLANLAFFFLCKRVAISAGVPQLGAHWPLSELSDLILPTHLRPYSLESGMGIEIVFDKVLSEPFEVRQAVEVRVEATLVGGHECEESGVDQLLLHVNGDFVGENLL